MDKGGRAMPQPFPAARVLEDLCRSPGVRGVALTGSWARGDATEGSDVDLLVLCGENRFDAAWHGGLLVETSRFTYEHALEKLGAIPMEAYRWLDARVLFDDGGLADLARAAREIYEAYRTPEREKRRLAHWLRSLALKLAAAEGAGDTLKARYLAATNAWVLLEAVWAVNDRPMPPCAAAYRLWPALEDAPFPGWFEELFHLDEGRRAGAVHRVIAWAAERLEG